MPRSLPPSGELPRAEPAQQPVVITRRATLGGMAKAALVPGAFAVPTAAIASDVGNNVQKQRRHDRQNANGALDPGDFGVVGDGVADDTTAIQAFFDACAQENCIASLGKLRIKISGPVHVRGIGLVFDTNSYGQLGDPGFYPVGSGYTALKITGCVPVFRCAVIGSGGVTLNESGGVISDTRPAIHGFQFGDTEAGGTLMISNIGYARAMLLAGTGFRAVGVWDSCFENISVEWCGSAKSYAFSVESLGSQTTNETVFNRVQVELSIYRAIFISPTTLSCTFNKIHSERAYGREDITTWQLGGSGVYNSTRLHSATSSGNVLIYGDNLVLNSFRGEGGIVTQVNASGGTITFHEPAATLAAAKDQSGFVHVIGGSVRAQNIGMRWTFLGTRLSLLEVDYVTDSRLLLADCCEIVELRSRRGQKISSGTLRKCTIRTGSFLAQETRLEGDTIFTPDIGSGIIRNARVIVDGSLISGDMTVDNAALELKNCAVIDGDLTILSRPQSLCDQGSYVTGKVRGWTFPVASEYLRHQRGMFCKNLLPAPGEAPGWLCVDSGDHGKSGIWKSLPPLV